MSGRSTGARFAQIVPVVFSLLVLTALGPTSSGSASLDSAGDHARGDESFIKGKSAEGNKGGDNKADTGLKPFEDVIKGCTKIDGLFPFWRDRDLGKLYMEIPTDRLDHPYICALSREAAEGFFFDNGAMLGEYIFVLHREGKKVHWIRPNLIFIAPNDSSFARAIERGVSNSLIGVMDLASEPHPDRKSLLVEPGQILLTDQGWVGFSLRETEAGYSLDKDGSYVDKVSNFPKNSEIEVVLNFRSDSPKVPVSTLADMRSFQHRYHWSLAERPPAGYRPRLADDRVGHFLDMREDYSNTRTETAYVRYVNRWRLEKQDPSAPVSPPKEPIVYWIENTVPVEYRDAVRRGILSWNRAFEKAGFRDAIVVQQMPDTAGWDPADIRYHVVRWILQPGGSYAVGPSRSDPTTGELFDADIRVSADITRVVYREWNDQIFPLSSPGRNRTDAVGGLAPSLYGIGCPDRVRGFGCELAEGLVHQAAFGLGLAAARGLFDPDSPQGMRYLNDYIEGLVCHEVGHTLGLRHNFKSSVINTLDQLQDTTRTVDVGVTGSIMDYTPVNLAREGERQGEYWQKGPGAYDLWAIEYAYTPIDAATPEDELAELSRIASRCADPLLAYGTDEDARGYDPSGIDPTVTQFDLGNDPILWSATRMDLASELWTKMDAYLDKPGQRYTRYRSLFSQGMGEYFMSSLILSKYIGGIYHRRDHVGDPGGRLPFEPVAAATQRRALTLLTERLFSEKSFAFSPDLLNKIAPERLPTFDWTIWSTVRIDPPFHAMVLRVQSLPLDRVYDPVTLSRIQDAEVRFSAGAEPFRLVDLFSSFRDAIWSEFRAARPVPGIRRNLQRAHLNRLIKLAVNPGPGTPEDATTLARVDLKWIRSECDRSLARRDLDPMTRAHYDETRDRITTALGSPMARPIPDPAAGPTG